MDQEEWVFREPKDGFSMRCDMRDSGVLCDVIICAGDERIEAHRAVLGTMIPYFQAMFAHGMVESRQMEIKMKSVDPLALRKLIDFIYTGEISITKQNMFSLVQTSTYLLLNSVTDACCKFLIQNINMKNAAAILKCAQLANNRYGMEKAHRYIRANIEKFLKSEEFLSIPYDILKQLISCDDLLVTNEEVIFEGVMIWIKAEEGNRRQYLFDLLKLVRMPLLNVRYLNEKVCTEVLIQQSECCRDLFHAVTTYHTSPETSNVGSLFVMNERQWREKLYSVCEDGQYNCYVTCYDPINRRWDKVFDILRPDSSVHKSVFGNEQIHILYCNVLISLNTKTRQKTVNPLPMCPGGAGVIFHHSQIYLFGRLVNSTAKKIFTCDPETAAYQEVGEMLESRSSPRALSLGGYIYIFGGYSQGALVLKTVERYDPVKKECMPISPMLTATIDFDISALNDKIYLYGQCMDEVFRDNCSLYVYNPKTNKWNLLRRFARSRSSVSLVTYTNRLFITDRISSGNIYSMDTYDPSEDEWKSIDSVVPCTTPRVHYNMSVSA